MAIGSGGPVSDKKAREMLEDIRDPNDPEIDEYEEEYDPGIEV